ncbi:MAG: ZIP family metal transporter [Candidatus Hydrogenedentes bacterium]|nr:ZIP family metal transporter [Candidatus Hydrogenedentota bacterium]
MTVELFKTLAFVAILLTGLAGGYLSLRLAASSRKEAIFSLGNCLAGGIFLGAGLIHMLPDAQEGFSAVAAGIDFPVVSVICACGFLLVLLIERVATSGHGHAGEEQAPSSKPVYPYVLALVLSIHSIITGIALGAEGTVAMAFVIVVAVLAHKGSAAFALSISLQRAGTARAAVWRTVILFSFMTPIGILAGAGLTRLLTGTAEEVFEAIFDALAAGTFLYVASMEIIEHEFAQRQRRVAKFACVTLGLALMAALAIWT